ncbi:MAG: hypothetical protein WAM60_05230 [Candidatus Promineifilaceae bacterium]
MAQAENSIKVYLEIGKKRIIAGALDWPGWCRIGRNEEDTLAALVNYGPRYGHVLVQSGVVFDSPADVSELVVVERLEGNSTTDFGAPAIAPTADEQPVSGKEYERFKAILIACWQAFDEAAAAAEGKTLRKGPRGGGRDLEGITNHVLEANRSYLSALGWKYKRDKSVPLQEDLVLCREAMLNGLAAAVRGEIPRQGPRGGSRWSPRYFVRRVTWHELDHVWEIEDRVV